MTSAVLSSFSEMFAFALQSFKLAAVLPSFLFFSLNALFILPALPQRGLVARFLSIEPTSQVVILVMLSFLLGYLLSILNIPLIKLFEGYPWRETWYGQLLVKAQKEAKKQLAKEISLREQEIAHLKDPLSQYEVWDSEYTELSKKLDPQISPKEQDLYVIKASYRQMERDLYPVSQEPFLPTTLGSIIASFEDYPNVQYGIDAVALWPRLVPTLTKEKFSIFVERGKVNFDLALNLCFLFFVFSLEIAYIGLVFAQDFASWLIAAVGVAGIAYLGLYRMAIIGAQGWGMSVRIAFDLYRYHLLASLYGEAPENFRDERKKWACISQFFRQGVGNENFQSPSISQVLDNPQIDMSKILDYSKVRTFMRQAQIFKGE